LKNNPYSAKNKNKNKVTKSETFCLETNVKEKTGMDCNVEKFTEGIEDGDKTKTKTEEKEKNKKEKNETKNEKKHKKL